jgi:hypothetical protein
VSIPPALIIVGVAVGMIEASVIGATWGYNKGYREGRLYSYTDMIKRTQIEVPRMVEQYDLTLWCSGALGVCVYPQWSEDKDFRP